MRSLLLLLVLSAGWLAAAESDLAAGAVTARQQAEESLAAERARIIEARATKAVAVTDLARKLAEARTRTAAAQAETSRLRTELDRLRVSDTGSETQLVQQLSRAANALHLELIPNGLTERAQAVAVPLLAMPDKLVAEAQVRLAEEEVQDRSGVTVKIPVLRVATARALACGDSTATRGVLASKGGLSLVSGPPLPVGLESALADPARVVIDIQGTWAGQAPPPHRSFGEWIKGGRMFIWPILSVGVIGVILAAMRTVALARLPVSRERLDRVLLWINTGRNGSAPVDTDSRHPLERILAAGVASLGQTRAAREAALDHAILSEAPSLQRGLALLLLLASIAPLLGLLGTVTGMIDLFSVIGAQGSGNARSLSGGISEALITTQAGMMVAVPLLVAHSLLNRAAERRILLLEEAASGLLGTDQMEGKETPPPALSLALARAVVRSEMSRPEGAPGKPEARTPDIFASDAKPQPSKPETTKLGKDKSDPLMTSTGLDP